LETFDQLEKERRGLDFEIEDLIKEMDMEKYYNNVQNALKLEDINPDSKLGKLIRKMRERAEEINKQQEAVQTMMKITGPSIKERIE
jgi:tRNA C32,U32 (ribose-2'-O)-methylase TrmJ